MQPNQRNSIKINNTSRQPRQRFLFNADMLTSPKNQTIMDQEVQTEGTYEVEFEGNKHVIDLIYL